ncbi:MAG: penicillin-binding protein 1C, partial [Alphaproteobacteria bacterium]|nr:penicillin-binding protein 1C [Alphaproteobacteria bacterium]
MRRRWRCALWGAALAAIGIIALDRILPPDLSRYRAQSPVIEDRSGDILHVATTRDGMWRLGADPEAVSPRYLALLLATEDHRFWHHPGVDPIALGRALWQLARHGRIVSGGSTITMQVARLLEPHRHDLAGKLFDIARALQLEAHHSKREILAVYLALAPFGGNIEGVRAASLAYFEHEPAALTDAEAALLVALPQRPTRLRPDRHPERAALAQRALLARQHLDAADDLPLVTRHPFATLAPHLARRLAGPAASGIVRTTLDAGIQRALEALARRERPLLGGPADLAILALANDDRAVLGYLGSADYLGAGGMIDMVRARRSPGSALKPFIYGLAFDEALIRPDTLIDDAPLRLGNYAPHNFDDSFHGAVTAREALQQSYNLPAVAILQRLGPARFIAALRQAGARIALPRGSETPSLPVALGGLGISLEDAAALYVALADHGKAAPLRLRAADPAPRGVPLMTAAAAAQIGDILRGAPPPDGIASVRARAIAYKTGTSYGFRDAWAIGYSP